MGRVDRSYYDYAYLGKRLWQTVRLFEACHRVRASVAFDIFQIQSPYKMGPEMNEIVTFNDICIAFDFRNDFINDIIL